MGRFDYSVVLPVAVLKGPNSISPQSAPTQSLPAQPAAVRLRRPNVGSSSGVDSANGHAADGHALNGQMAPALPPSAVEWTPPLDMDQRTWILAGRRLGRISRVSNWWIGDWLRYGSTRWGQKYVTAAKITGYDPHSLENMVYVASRIESSLRRENLSWSHHALVAPLDQDRQQHWLELASAHRLSVADLRVELRTAQRVARREQERCDGDLKRAPRITFLVCPRCGEEIALGPPGAPRPPP
jgi:hypothetical protein